MATYTFGGYALNSFSAVSSTLAGLFFESKNFDLPVVKPIAFNIARRDGQKKSGEVVEPRTIPVDIVVVGTSRSDLISRLDALQQALSLRGQQLMIHEDSSARYYKNVDCISAEAPLGKGSIIACTVKIKFLAYDPYAYAGTSSSYDTGTVALTLSGGLYNFPAINITGGGTVYAYPLIHIINKSGSAGQWNSIQISQTQDSQTLTANSTASVPLPLNNGDYVDVQCDPSVGMSIITNNNGKLSDPVGLFPVVECGTTTFNIGISCGSAVSAEAIISWTQRYMS
jgi:hypothetical protein